MKTQANNLYLFRGMSNHILVEIAQLPATENYPVAVSLLAFTSKVTEDNITFSITKENGTMNGIYKYSVNNKVMYGQFNNVSGEALAGVLQVVTEDIL